MKKILSAIIFSFSFLFAHDVIKVGTNPNFPPFEYLDKDSKVAGFDVDFINELCKRTDKECSLVVMSFDALIPALKSGKIDVAISGMSATPVRKNAVDFSNPYFTTENLYIKKANDENIKTLDDLKGKKIGVQLGTVQETRAREISNKVFPTEDPYSSVLALKTGKVDVFVVDTSVGYEYLKQNSDLVSFFKEADGSDGFAIAFDKDKQTNLIKAFNKAFEEMKKDGSYDKLLVKYNLK